MRSICVVLVAMAACVLGLATQGTAQTVRHTALRNSVFLGEPLEIQTTVNGVNNKADFVKIPLVDTGKQWFLASAIVIDTMANRNTLVMKYQVVCFDSGDVELLYTDGLLVSGAVVRATANSTVIKVLPVPITGMKELHPAEPLLTPKQQEPTVNTWLVATLASAFLAMLLLVVWWRKRKKIGRSTIDKAMTSPSYETLLLQRPETVEQWQQWAAEVYVLLHHEFPTLKNITASKNWPAQVPTSLQSLYQQISSLLFAKAIPNATPQQLLEPLIVYINQKNK
jgi:hypothetical protein